MTINEQISASFKEYKIGTNFTRNEIIELVHNKYGTDKSSIIPSDYCYSTTGKVTNKKHIGPKYFLNIDKGIFKYVGENYTENQILKVINLYKKNIDEIRKNEIYKWEALQWYKDNWDINAENFCEMFKTSFNKTKNLLASNMYYPYKMACIFVEKDAEIVRSLFRNLNDESISLNDRYIKFSLGFKKYLEKLRKEGEVGATANSHYQDLHAISVYLSFEYPQKYYLYKFKEYKNFMKLIGFSDYIEKKENEVWKIDNYNRMCDKVLQFVRNDKELQEMSKQRLDDNCYKDESFHLLVSDIVYYGSHIEDDEQRYSSKLRDELNEALNESKDILDKIDLPNNTVDEVTKNELDIHRNTILYGPPGTGKTYNTVIYAVAIIEQKPLDDIMYEDYEIIFKRFKKYKSKGLIENITFHQAYGYEEFIEGIKPVLENDSDGNIKYEITSGIFKSFCEKTENGSNYVFIIDEINRGNISKIFGELITLIETTKRIGQAEEMFIKLPYSNSLFGVPDNVYIIGTMNTADRSISTIDTALRRRFKFKEMQPDVSILKDIYVEDISISEMLLSMNRKITVLYDREHTIGQAYFIPLTVAQTIDVLSDIFLNSIIPLLQEYFYDDYEKIRLVLGDNNKDNKDEQFITVQNNDYAKLFGKTNYYFDESKTYEINYNAFDNIESYRSI